jgi:hypothetical protein
VHVPQEPLPVFLAGARLLAPPGAAADREAAQETLAAMLSTSRQTVNQLLKTLHRIERA